MYVISMDLPCVRRIWPGSINLGILCVHVPHLKWEMGGHGVSAWAFCLCSYYRHGSFMHANHTAATQL